MDNGGPDVVGPETDGSQVTNEPWTNLGVVPAECLMRDDVAEAMLSGSGLDRCRERYLVYGSTEGQFPRRADVEAVGITATRREFRSPNFAI